MSTIANRLREIASRAEYAAQVDERRSVADALIAIADELEAAPAADAAMPAYGTIPWDALVAAVGEAKGSAFEVDPTYYVGHQMCGINMNSLNRIVSKFVAALQAQIASLQRASDIEAQCRQQERDNWLRAEVQYQAQIAELEARQVPIDMVLHCPQCHEQHIDEPGADVDANGPCYDHHWDNPPHRSHLCHGCGHIWRPADVPTNGVAAVKTRGKNDSVLTASAPSNPTTQPPEGR